MELGIGMFGDNHYDEHGKPMAAGDRLRELIEEIKLMDDVGIEFFGIGEHRHCRQYNQQYRLQKIVGGIEKVR